VVVSPQGTPATSSHTRRSNSRPLTSRGRSNVVLSPARNSPSWRATSANPSSLRAPNAVRSGRGQCSGKYSPVSEPPPGPPSAPQGRREHRVHSGRGTTCRHCHRLLPSAAGPVLTHTRQTRPKRRTWDRRPAWPFAAPAHRSSRSENSCGAPHVRRAASVCGLRDSTSRMPAPAFPQHLTKEEKPCLLPVTTAAARPASGSRSRQAPLEQRKRIRTPPRPRPASVPPRRPPGEGHQGKPLPRCQRPRPPAPGRTGQATGSPRTASPTGFPQHDERPAPRIPDPGPLRRGARFRWIPGSASAIIGHTLRRATPTALAGSLSPCAVPGSLVSARLGRPPMSSGTLMRPGQCHRGRRPDAINPG
jgi:hypothetical protein